jgi:broad specificity phosphatase PhoE
VEAARAPVSALYYSGMSETTIHFIRHGEVLNPAGRFYGRLPRYPLSNSGRIQAQQAANHLEGSPVRAVIASPLLRARQTADIIANWLGGIPVSYSQLILECHTPYDDWSVSQLEDRHWDLYTGNQPPYELPEDVITRACRFAEKTRLRYAGQQVVAVTHADVILFLALWANGLQVNYENKARVERGELPICFPATASITSLAWKSGQSLPEHTYTETW